MSPKLLVIGAGPAGAAAATCLAQAGAAVTIVDRGIPKRLGASLTPKIEPLLAILGARERVEAAGFTRMSGTAVWAEGLSFHPFAREERRGYQVDRARFDRLLLEHALGAGASWVEARVLGPAAGGVETDEGRMLADFVIDASGPAAVLARHLGLRVAEEPRTMVLTAWYRGSRVPDGCAAESTLFELAPDAWIWSLLTAEGLRSVSVGVDPRGRSGAEELHAEVLAESAFVGPLVARAARVGPLEIHDASRSASTRYAGSVDGLDFALAGDAASVIDPLSSQGVYKALQSGIVAAAVARTALERPADRPMAFDYFDAEQRRFAEGYGAIVATMYARSPHLDRPFWRARAATPAALPAERRAAFLERVRVEGGALRVAASGLRIEGAPTTHGGYIERRPHFVGSGAVPLAGIDGERLLALLDGRPLAAVFDGYAAAIGAAPSAALGRSLIEVLADLAGSGMAAAARPGT